MKLIFLSIFVSFVTMASAGNVVVEGNNKFGVNMFKLLSKEDENLLVSPFSAHACLTMAYEGADGQTATDLGQVLQVPNAEEAANEYEKLTKQLNDVKSVTLEIANKIYIQQQFTLRPTYKQVLETKFSAEAEEIDFAQNVVAAKNINTWVEKKTRDKIHDLISSDALGGDTRLVLVNALYFKGDWDKKFDKDATAKKPFHLLNGNEIQVDMMHRNGKYRFADNAELNSKVLELPYKDHQFSMVVFLPNENNGITQLEEKIKNVNISDIMQQLTEYTVDVELPKFKIESTIPMNDVLKKLGAEIIFTNNANFSKISEGSQLKVSDVIQKTFIEVNEEGAEAAAATGLVFETLSLPLPPKLFIADHPFLFYLKTSKAHAIFFMGHVAEPKTEA